MAGWRRRGSLEPVESKGGAPNVQEPLQKAPQERSSPPTGLVVTDFEVARASCPCEIIAKMAISPKTALLLKDFKGRADIHSVA